MPLWIILLLDTGASALAAMALIIAIFYNEYVARATDNTNLLDEIGILETRWNDHQELEHYDEFGLSVGSAKSWKATALQLQKDIAEEKRRNSEQWDRAYKIYPDLPDALFNALAEDDGGAGS